MFRNYLNNKLPTLAPFFGRSYRVIHSSASNISSAVLRILKGACKPILAVLVILFLIHSIATLILSRRFMAAVEKLRAQGEPVIMSDLRGRPIPKNQNGAVIYEKVFQRLKNESAKKDLDTLNLILAEEGVINNPERHNEQLPASSSLWADAKMAAERQAVLIPLVEKAQAFKQCRFPVNWEEGAGALFPHMAHLRAITRMLSAQAIIQARDGNMDSAFHNIIVAFEVSRAVRTEPSLINLLVGIHCAETANDALGVILKYGNPTGAQTAMLFSALSKVDFGPTCIIAMKGERAMGLWAFNLARECGTGLCTDYSSEGPGLEDKLYNSTITYVWRPISYADEIVFLDVMQNDINNAGKPYRLIKQQKSDKEIPEYARVTQIMAPVCSRVVGASDSIRAKVQMTQALLAAISYKTKAGIYPKSMADLRQSIKLRIPVDPFSGKDFKYLRTANGFRIYSIGLNLEDDGGKTPINNGRPPKTDDGSSSEGDLVLNWCN